MIPKNGYTTFQILEKLGIKRDRLNDWMTRGYIEPSIQRASGQGTKNLFNRFDLYLIKVFEHMLSRGFSREVATDRIKWLKKELKSHPANDDTWCQYVAFGETFSRQIREGVDAEKAVRERLWCRCMDNLSDGTLLDAMRDYDDIYILNFGKLRKEVDEAIAQ